MELLVDIGNTRTKVAAFQFGKMLIYKEFIGEIDHDLRISIELLNPSHGIVSTVAEKSEVWQKTFPTVQWVEFNHTTPVPFLNAYSAPNLLGLDRMALAAAAVSEFAERNVLVIDAGTCVTYDVVTAQGEYLGGAIAPGFAMRLKAMNHFTAKLPLVEAESNAPLIGNSTRTCLQSGALHGLASEVDGMIARYNEQFDSLIVVVTGGDLSALAPLLKNNIFARPNFLLQGLHVILAFNTP